MITPLLLFAFTAGAVAFFAPCCVGMLPAYVAYAVRPAGLQGRALPRERSPRAVVLALGLVPFAFGTVPLIMRSLGGYGLVPGGAYAYLPPLEVSIGLVILGAALILNAFVWTDRLSVANRSLAFGLLATLGVFLGFLIVGAPVALLATLVTPYLGIVSILVGLAILALGILTLAGRSFAPKLPSITPDVTRPWGFVKFGLAYAVAGLTCTFPAFLAVMAAGLATGGFGTALAVFAAYALGKASVLVAVTAVTVASGETFAPKLARHARLVETASGCMLILAGAFMIYYYSRANLPEGFL